MTIPPHDPRRWSFLVPAAGAGERLGLGPKCLLELGGEPLWERAVRRASPLADEVVVAVPASLVVDVERAAAGRCRVVAGGGTRQETVERLVAASSAGMILVHDAARPFGSDGLVRAVASLAESVGAAACLAACRGPVVEVGPDGVGRVVGTGRRGVAETPLAFRRGVLEDACRWAREGGIVAGSTVELVMAAGHAVRFVDSEPDNVKITSLDDLRLARRLVGAGEVSGDAGGVR